MEKAIATRSSRQAYTGSKQISFLPAPEFNPKLPPKNTFTDIALRILLEGGRITSVDFQHRTASQRLAAYIHVLVKLGWPVMTDDIVVLVNEEPKRRILTKYYFESDVVDKYKKYLGGVR